MALSVEKGVQMSELVVGVPLRVCVPVSVALCEALPDKGPGDSVAVGRRRHSEAARESGGGRA